MQRPGGLRMGRLGTPGRGCYWGACNCTQRVCKSADNNLIHVITQVRSGSPISFSATALALAHVVLSSCAGLVPGAPSRSRLPGIVIFRPRARPELPSVSPEYGPAHGLRPAPQDPHGAMCMCGAWPRAATFAATRSSRQQKTSGAPSRAPSARLVLWIAIRGKFAGPRTAEVPYFVLLSSR